MSIDDVSSVADYKPIIEAHTERLLHARQESENEAPVIESDCPTLLQQVKDIKSQLDIERGGQSQHAAIETVLREDFVDVVATVDISDPAFARVWVLLDIATILSDNELCEAALNFWLIEELLDSQTIDGCRKVFDYLESRRERITAKHFKLKSLVILRCCNELLRRLSRAEDTVFCGRVFIFLFQSFPLGDKSSVNLRGEFHVENVTIFDPSPQKSEDAIKPMEIDTEGTQQVLSSGPHTPASSMQDIEKTSRSTPSGPRSTKAEPKSEEPPDLDALYPRFWTLQTFFSSPTKLFEQASMTQFKDGISATLSCFKSVSNISPTTTTTDNIKRGTKRKHSSVDSNATVSSSTFNPKYLTNRDLFDLEIHDLAFRRHILVQSLILIDFLLSLSPTGKQKAEGLANKSVLYPFTLSEEDTKWCQSTRASIASYLQQSGSGNEGKFYFRMVDTVLSRDKNWVRWKAESCPSITRPSIDAKTHVEAQKTLARISEQQKRALPLPPGAADLNFLAKNEPLEALKRPSQRHKVPSMEEYWKSIQGDDLDLDFAMTEAEKKEIEERKAGRVWRALRGSGKAFGLAERLRFGENLKALIGEEEEAAAAGEEGNKKENGGGDGEGEGNAEGEDGSGTTINGDHGTGDGSRDTVLHGSDETVKGEEVPGAATEIETETQSQSDEAMIDAPASTTMEAGAVETTAVVADTSA